MQLLPTASVLPQVEELMAKSPLATMLAMLRVPVPELVMVTDLAAEVLPVTVFANARDVGVSVTAG